jgi:uncharacterized protein YgiM (DUF1202 family)
MPCKPLVKRCKTVAEKLQIGFDLTDVCANRWVARQVVDVDETVRPTEEMETGSQYRVTVAGQTGTTEPNWNQATVTDGTVTYAREAIDNDSLARTIVNVTWDGDGLSLSDDELINTGGEQQIAAMVSGGTVGKHYPTATVEFSDGQEREYSQEITVNA